MPAARLQGPWDVVVLGQHVPTWAAGRHRPWTLHGQFHLRPLLWHLGLQAQQHVVVHGSRYRGHHELQHLAFLQPNKARASPRWSAPRGRQTLHHIEHLPLGFLSLPS